MFFSKVITLSIVFAVTSFIPVPVVCQDEEVCGNYVCCLDCECCGQGTVWNAEQNGCSTTSANGECPTPWTEGCITPVCAEGGCCREGATFDAESCLCVDAPKCVIACDYLRSMTGEPYPECVAECPGEDDALVGCLANRISSEESDENVCACDGIPELSEDPLRRQLQIFTCRDDVWSAWKYRWAYWCLGKSVPKDIPVPNDPLCMNTRVNSVCELPNGKKGTCYQRIAGLKACDCRFP